MNLAGLITTIVKSREFQIIGAPICFSFIGIYSRKLGRRDGDDTPKQNDWALSTTILLMCVSVILTDVKSISTNLTDSIAWLALFLVMIFASLSHDRYNSWVRDKTTKLPTKHKSWFLGIILPNLISIALYASYQYNKV